MSESFLTLEIDPFSFLKITFSYIPLPLDLSLDHHLCLSLFQIKKLLRHVAI